MNVSRDHPKSMLNKLKPFTFTLTATGTIAFITGVCGLFVVGASKPNANTQQIKSFSEFLGKSGAAAFVIGYPIVMMPKKKHSGDYLMANQSLSYLSKLRQPESLTTCKANASN
ncbi:hypothetical protein [Synechococcus sp. A15-127]|uniref:hypothetical protein n=1 Tax=Synechococcus sp. A15-127 TaxID=1050624 RepID=UPI00164596BB|nr:hypothetical protein [Synechococcus sp. A15-127]